MLNVLQTKSKFSLTIKALYIGLVIIPNWAPNSYISVIREIKENIERLIQKGTNAILSWTPGHANKPVNDEADILVKQQHRKQIIRTNTGK